MMLFSFNSSPARAARASAAAIFHFFIDLRGAHIQRAAEDAGERQNVVDLVGIVAAARGNDPCAAGASVVRKISGVGLAQAK